MGVNNASDYTITAEQEEKAEPKTERQKKEAAVKKLSDRQARIRNLEEWQLDALFRFRDKEWTFEKTLDEMAYIQSLINKEHEKELEEVREETKEWMQKLTQEVFTGKQVK